MNYNDDVLLDHALTMRRLGMDAEEEEDLPLAARLYKQAIISTFCDGDGFFEEMG